MIGKNDSPVSNVWKDSFQSLETSFLFAVRGGYSDSFSLNWDERYRLTTSAVSSGSTTSTVTYEYDVSGRRMSRTCHSPQATNEVLFVYDGNQVIADIDGESGEVLRSYVWGPGIDNLLAMTVYGETTNTYYAIKDHLNSVIAFTDASGNIVESYEYDAWGRVLSVIDGAGNPLTSDLGRPISGLGNRYLFQGREYDFTTGLYYFRARWYDPVSGRFLLKDPKGISGGLNLYVFCGNNPVNFTDPFGLQTFDPYASGTTGTTNIDLSTGLGWNTTNPNAPFTPNTNGTPFSLSEPITRDLFATGAGPTGKAIGGAAKGAGAAVKWGNKAYNWINKLLEKTKGSDCEKE